MPSSQPWGVVKVDSVSGRLLSERLEHLVGEAFEGEQIVLVTHVVARG